MRAKNIEEMLEREGFNLTEDNTDALNYGNKVYVWSDGKERVQVIVSVEKVES